MKNRISLLILLSIFFSNLRAQGLIDHQGALVRSDTSEKVIYLVFSGHDFDEGFDHVLSVLEKKGVLASFFFTGDFVRNHTALTKRISELGHFVGAHSDRHLLYCDWENRDSLLFSPGQIKKDIADNLVELDKIGINPHYFLPPYEWYNSQVVLLANDLGQRTVNFSPGTRSNADYTSPDMSNYVGTEEILDSIFSYEKEAGMNGFHLLIHPGTSELRKDKLYLRLAELISGLEELGYAFQRFN
ncbi:polysaccharide deacetylase family protein [Algoriphagus aestuarii]|nr:polysaccharide deacetylase family protein [Algoriphagus aestuarii]